MENDRFITLQHICRHYNVEISFIRSLNEYGLLEITSLEKEECVDKDSLGDIEKMMRLHYDLDINMEGIDAIHHLLRRMDEMQKDIRDLKNRLNSQ
jgi:hypothetical protein